MNPGTVFATIAAPIAIAVIAAGLCVLYRAIPRTGATKRAAVLSAVIALIGAIVWLAIGVPLSGGVMAGLIPAITVLAGVATTLATFAVRERVSNTATAVVFAAVWCAAVFVPVAIADFSPTGYFESLGLEPLDHGGALAVFVAPASAAVAVLVIERGRKARTTLEAYPTAPVWTTIAMWAGWVLALVCLELAIDEVTPQIVLNALLAPVFGVLGWLVIQRVHHQVSTVAGAAAGLVTGLAGITAGAAFVDPLWASVTGFGAAALSAAFVHRRVRLSQLESWFIVGAHLVAPVTGLALLGLFASGIGFVFSGQISLAQAEFVSIVVTIAYSVVVSALLWLLLRFTLARRAIKVSG